MTFATVGAEGVEGIGPKWREASEFHRAVAGVQERGALPAQARNVLEAVRRLGCSGTSFIEVIEGIHSWGLVECIAVVGRRRRRGIAPNRLVRPCDDAGGTCAHLGKRPAGGE